MAVLPFSKLHKIYFGYFYPERFLKIMKINAFRGDRTDISAKKEALACRGTNYVINVHGDIVTVVTTLSNNDDIDDDVLGSDFVFKIK